MYPVDIVIFQRVLQDTLWEYNNNENMSFEELIASVTFRYKRKTDGKRN